MYCSLAVFVVRFGSYIQRGGNGAIYTTRVTITLLLYLIVSIYRGYVHNLLYSLLSKSLAFISVYLIVIIHVLTIALLTLISL